MRQPIIAPRFSRSYEGRFADDDVVLRPRGVLDGCAHRAGRKRREISATEGRSRRRRAAHGDLPQDQPAGTRTGAEARQRGAAGGEHCHSAVSRQALRIVAERSAADPAAFPTLKETGLKSFHGYLKQIDQRLSGREWFGDQYSVVDPYGFVFYTWGVRRELPMGELKHYTAFKDRMLARPAVKRVVEDEKVKV